MEDQPPPRPWYYRVGFVLSMLFLVLGPFALPLLWKSPDFPKWAKIGLTAAVLIFMGILIILTLWAANQVAENYRQLELLF